MCSLRALALLFMLPVFSAPFAEEAKRVCLNAAETRVAVAEHRLADPLAALRAAARKGQTEPLRSRLCRWNDRFVYEMALLRRDGKVVRVFIDAIDGVQAVSAP